MSPPSSDFFKVEIIHSAGRSLVATQNIATNILILASHTPAAHVVFRQYRKEVCAYCYFYDRGRTLPVRDNATGKVFCAPKCQASWAVKQGDLGAEAWRTLHTFVQARSKNIMSGSGLASVGPRPDVDAIAAAWAKAREKGVAKPSDEAGKPSLSTEKKSRSAQTQDVDPDILSLFLSGIVAHDQTPGQWNAEVQSLAMDDQPYKSTQDLEAHCNSYTQLTSILPPPLLSKHDISAVCKTIVAAGNHNAFGIRSGSEDGEEYMGYAIYPSASYFNHSCRPNLVKRRVGRCWEFSTAREIFSGEECCITYLGGDERDMNVLERRARLQEVWGFVCRCSRCVDEQE